MTARAASPINRIENLFFLKKSGRRFFVRRRLVGFVIKSSSYACKGPFRLDSP
jgi:hypothetical protein